VGGRVPADAGGKGALEGALATCGSGAIRRSTWTLAWSRSESGGLIGAAAGASDGSSV
jgi:hypothetical protein